MSDEKESVANRTQIELNINQLAFYGFVDVNALADGFQRALEEQLALGDLQINLRGTRNLTNLLAGEVIINDDMNPSDVSIEVAHAVHAGLMK